MANSIEITTTQNVTIEYEPAKLRNRMIAFIIDIAVVVFGYYILFFLMISLFGDDGLNQWWQIFFMILGFVSYFLYHIISEVVFQGQSLGKRATNSKVVRLDGKEPQWSDVVLRAMLQIVDIFFSVGIIGIILIKTTPKGQRLGDMAANTAVIKLQGTYGRFTLGEILNIASISNYQPIYPQVRTLNENDMILIKNTLARYQKYPNEAHASAVDTWSDRLMELLEIPQVATQRTDFLKTLLRDYIVLTR